MNDDSIPEDNKQNYLLDNVNFHRLKHLNAPILIKV